MTDLESELVLAKNKIKSLQKTVNQLQQNSQLSLDESSQTHFDCDNEYVSKEQKYRITQLEDVVDRGQKALRILGILQEIAPGNDIEKKRWTCIGYLKQPQKNDFHNESNDKSQDDFDEEKNVYNIGNPESSNLSRMKEFYLPLITMKQKTLMMIPL